MRKVFFAASLVCLILCGCGGKEVPKVSVVKGDDVVESAFDFNDSANTTGVEDQEKNTEEQTQESEWEGEVIGGDMQDQVQESEQSGEGAGDVKEQDSHGGSSVFVDSEPEGGVVIIGTDNKIFINHEDFLAVFPADKLDMFNKSVPDALLVGDVRFVGCDKTTNTYYAEGEEHYYKFYISEGSDSVSFEAIMKKYCDWWPY